jgi:hypothetical protein
MSTTKHKTKGNPVTVEVAEIEDDILEDFERQTTVHCSIKVEAGTGLRIWPTTFLVEAESGIRRNLVHHLNIPLAPQWLVVEKTSTYQFTLFFEGLSRNCILFDLIEEIPEEGGFNVPHIHRNNSDVYKLSL